MTISGASAKYRSTSRVARLRRCVVTASAAVTATRASPVASTSNASALESIRVSTNAPAVAAITSNTRAINRKRTSTSFSLGALCSSLANAAADPRRAPSAWQPETVTARRAMQSRETSTSFAQPLGGDADAAERPPPQRLKRPVTKRKEDAMSLDYDLTADVGDELFWDPKVDSAAIAVSADGGTITLRGTVGSLREKREAKKAAQRVFGVSSVDNQLK